MEKRHFFILVLMNVMVAGRTAFSLTMNPEHKVFTYSLLAIWVLGQVILLGSAHALDKRRLAKVRN